jgi:hypothetical protein
MKRVALFVLLALALDRGVDALLARLQRTTLTGERLGLLNYALTKEAGILVLGSSRAQFQIMPSVLHERLSLDSYNAGLKGHDFLYAMLLFDLWKTRHAPAKAVVLTMDIESLLERENENAGAQIFAPYLDESALVREVLYTAGPWKRLAYLSRAYRWNGKVLAIAKNVFAHPDPRSDGFLPAIGKLDPGSSNVVVNALDQDRTAIEFARQAYSERKLRYLRAFADETARTGTRVFLVHTPLYRQDPEAHQVWMTRLKELTGAMPNVEIVDLCPITHPELFSRAEVYRDFNHLGPPGAEVLTNLLADAMAPRLGPARPRGGAAAP